VPPDGRRPPLEVRAYAVLLAAYLHGSAVLGGWSPEVSDVDVLVVLAEDVSPRLAQGLADAAISTLAACPGTGLEMSAVSGLEAAAPRPPWRFVVHVAGHRLAEPTVVRGDGHPGDPDLLLHYEVCRTAGWPVLGPPATEVIGPVNRAAVLAALAAELTWGLSNAPGPYALLNACRALTYLHERRLVAKTVGGRWALDHRTGPSDGIRRALAAQADRRPAAALTDVEMAFVRRTALQLAAAADEAAQTQ